MSSPGASGETHKLPTDAELLAQTVGGNESAFKQLVDRHGRYLFGIAHSLSGNAADAEDLVQETLVAALGSKFRGESAVRTWLVGILVRRAGMLHRTRKRHARSLTFFGRGESQPPEPAAYQSAPGGSGGTDARLDLSVMLQRLSPEHRQIIVLRELEGLTYEQIAATLGVPRGTVESRLHRAREELRKRFKGYEP